jgi:hypothetical protein
MELDTVSITSGFPSRYLLTHQLFVADPAVQTLAIQYPNFDFRPIEPAPMLGGVVQLQAVQQAAGLRRWKDLIQAWFSSQAGKVTLWSVSKGH